MGGWIEEIHHFLFVNLKEGTLDLKLLDTVVVVVDRVATVENLLDRTWDDTLRRPNTPP